MRISHKIVILMGLAIAACALLFSIGIYVEKRAALLDGMDEKLHASALCAKALMGEEYHDGIQGKDSVGKAEYMKAVDRYNRLCRQLDLQYLWSLMLVGETVVFTSSTSTSHDLKNGDHAQFFDTHTNPGAYREVFRTMTPQYQVSSDEWGGGRAALLPFTDRHGRKYLFGASMAVSGVDTRVATALRRSLLMGAVILAAGLAVGLYVARSLARPIVRLEQVAEAIADGDRGQEVPPAGSLEIASLAGSINRMSRAIRKQLAALERFRFALDNSGDALFLIDRDAMRFVDVNRTACESTGYSRQELLAMGPHHIKPSISKEELAAVFDKVIAEGEAAILDTEHRRKDGSKFPVEIPLRAMETAEGTFMVASVRDMTERKATARTLQESHERFRALVDALDSLVFVSDLENCDLLFINRYGRELFGEVTGKNCWQALHSDLSGPCGFCAGGNLVDDTGSPTGVQVREFNSGKSGRWYECRDQAIRWTDGRLVRMEIATDITERKTAEAEMARLQDYLNSIVDSMPSVLVGADDQGRVTLWNSEAVKTTGLTPQEAMGRSIEAVLPMAGIDSEMIRRTIQRESPRQEDRIAARGEGSIRHFDVTLYPLAHGDRNGVVVRMDDVTDRARIDELLVQSEKMMSVGGLAAGMAHEINNPLGVILGAAQTVVRRFSPDLKKNRDVADALGIDLCALRTYMQKRAVTEYIEAILEAGERSAHIVRNMLDFSRRSESIREQHHLHTLLDKAIDLAGSDFDLRSAHDFKSIRIERSYDFQLPMLGVIETEIEQVFLNLLKNAAHAMAAKEYGKEHPVISIKTQKEGPFARIDLSDNGPGMEETVRKRVFEPFFTTKEVGTGTGLGLSVSYFIITKNHRGQIGVESQPGHGTRFSIRLPLEKAAS